MLGSCELNTPVLKSKIIFPSTKDPLVIPTTHSVANTKLGTWNSFLDTRLANVQIGVIVVEWPLDLLTTRITRDSIVK